MPDSFSIIWVFGDSSKVRYFKGIMELVPEAAWLEQDGPGNRTFSFVKKSDTKSCSTSMAHTRVREK
jgi:hypothetical protein